MLQFLAETAEHFIPSVRAVIVFEFLERVRLRGVEECPEMVFGDEVFGVGDVGLFERAVFVFAGKEIRDVILKGEFRRFLPRHALFSADNLESVQFLYEKKNSRAWIGS